MKEPVTKTCEHCGCAFECGGYQCWCGDVGITERHMDWISTRFHDCLCPDCLRKVAAGELGSSSITSVNAPEAAS